MSEAHPDANLVRTAITDAISASGALVRGKVISHFVDIEIDRRSKMIIDGLNKLTDAEAAVAKMKPDQVFFNDEGKPAHTLWSADAKGKREKAQKVVTRLQEALAKALDESDYKPLEEALKGN